MYVLAGLSVLKSLTLLHPRLFNYITDHINKWFYQENSFIIVIIVIKTHLKTAAVLQ